ncbi:MAG: hypothetical protein WC548_02760 [Candidatus Pacearchaeota archaeon]
MNDEFSGYYLIPIAMFENPDGGFFNDTFAVVYGVGKMDALFKLREHPNFKKTFTTRDGKIEKYSLFSLSGRIAITDEQELN